MCWIKREHHQAVIKSFEGKEAPMDTLIAHIMFDRIKGTFMSADSDQVMEISASVIPFSPKLDPRWAVNIPSSRSTTLKVFPDSGATLCLLGPKHLFNMGLTKNILGGFTLMC